VKNGIVAAYDPLVISRKILSIPREEKFSGEGQRRM
jgi:hypothetical protein